LRGSRDLFPALCSTRLFESLRAREPNSRCQTKPASSRPQTLPPWDQLRYVQLQSTRLLSDFKFGRTGTNSHSQRCRILKRTSTIFASRCYISEKGARETIDHQSTFELFINSVPSKSQAETMGPRTSFSVMLMLSNCDGCNGNGPDDQFVTQATLAKMPRNGSLRQTFFDLTAKCEVLTSCTRTSLGRTLALTSTLVLIDDQEKPNVQPRCSRGGFCADAEEPSHECSGPSGTISCWHLLHQAYPQPSMGHCKFRASLNPSLSK
jgi:hypothetical protein